MDTDDDAVEVSERLMDIESEIEAVPDSLTLPDCDAAGVCERVELMLATADTLVEAVFDALALNDVDAVRLKLDDAVFDGVGVTVIDALNDTDPEVVGVAVTDEYNEGVIEIVRVLENEIDADSVVL